MNLFFIDSDTIIDAINEKCDFFDEMIVSKIIANSNICFCDVANVINVCDSNETNESSKIDFFSFCKNVCVWKKNVFVKTISKSCKKMNFDWFSNQMSTKSQKIIFIHSSNFDSQHKCWHCWKCWMKMMIWLNRFFFKFWWNWFELKISKFANSDNVFDCTTSKAENDELIVDIFVDFDVISNAKNWKIERFNKMIASNVIADSNIDFWDFVNDSCDFCEANDFFFVSHIKLTALIERWEFSINFRVSWLRICSYNFLLKLKFCLQNLQIARIFIISWSDEFSIDFDIISSDFNWRFEFFETRRINVFENAFVKILSKRFNEINSNWILNHLNAKLHKHFDNKFNRFDLRYRCWHCSKCCKKFVISLYCSKSNSLQTDESNVSISWNFDVDFTIIVFNSIRFAIFRTLRFVRFWVIVFNFRCFCEKNVFVKIISKRDKKLKCDRFLNHFQTKSLRIHIMYSSNFVFRYRYNSWQCSRFRRKLVTSLNCLIFESEHDRFELKKSISREKSKKSKFENSENIENIAEIWKKRWLTR